MKRCRLFSVWFASVALASGTAAADEALEDELLGLSLEQLMNVPVRGVSISEGRAVALPASVTVITREQIDALRPQNLLELLNIVVPGFDALPYRSTTGTYGASMSSRGIRSSASQQVLVLVDNFIELNGSVTGAPRVPVEFDVGLLERVEISRSPSPTLGGGAITVVNLVTRAQFAEGTSVGVEGAVHADAQPSTDLPRLRFGGISGARVAGMHVGAAVSYTRDEGSRLQVDVPGRGPTAASDATDSSVQATLTARSASSDVVVRGMVLREERSNWFAGLDANRLDRRDGDENLLATLDVTVVPTGDLILRAGLSAGRRRVSHDVGDEEVFASNLKDVQGSVRASYRRDVELFGLHELDVGVAYEINAVHDHYYETWDGESFVRLDAGTLTSKGAVVQNVFGGWIADTWTIVPRLVASAGLRVDWYHGWADRQELGVSPRAAIGYALTDAIELKLIQASSFRPPTLYERSGIDAFPSIGDPRVRSERVHSVEFSASYRHDRLRARVTPFVEWHLDRLDYVSDGGGAALVAQNVGTMRALGMEAEASYELPGGSRLFGHAAFVESIDVATGVRTPDWPRFIAGGGMIARLGDLDFTNTVYLRALRTRPPGQDDIGGDAPVHLRWDSSVGYRIVGLVDVHAIVRNVTDDDSVVLTPRRGLALPRRGRSFFLGLRLHFGGAT